VDRAHFALTEQRGLKWYASSANVRRGFCVECGSCLFFDEAGDHKLGFCAGTLDAPTELRSKAHIFVASKGDYYSIADDGLLRLEGSP
jgi:hypothetical protein